MNQRVLVYEHICATQLAEEMQPSLLAEGRAMLGAVGEVFGRVPGLEWAACFDGRVDRNRWPEVGASECLAVEGSPAQWLKVRAHRYDGVLLIAPEMDGVLAELARAVEDGGGRLLGPGADAIEAFSDKLATAKMLGELSPPTVLWPESPTFDGPYIVKPRFGVGALHTARATVWPGVGRFVETCRQDGFAGEFVVQPFVAGDSPSVGIVGVKQSDGIHYIVLPAVEQQIQFEPTANGRETIHYAGGMAPATIDLDTAARRVVEDFLQVAPEMRGYFGLDLIVADEGYGKVIDVNPRLTTSVVAYAKLFPRVLGEMLCGRSPPTGARIVRRQLESLVEPFCFGPDG